MHDFVTVNSLKKLNHLNQMMIIFINFWQKFCFRNIFEHLWYRYTGKDISTICVLSGLKISKFNDVQLIISNTQFVKVLYC